MPIVKYQPLEAPNLAQLDDLLPYVYNTIRDSSLGQLNDFSAHSPIVAMAEGLDFAMRELRYALNRFAKAAAINHLKIAGIQRRIGASAEVYVTFTLTAPLSNWFVLSAGYMVHTSDDLEFLTDEQLQIPPGAISGTVRATSRGVGTAYNVPANSITQLSEARAFLKSVTNADPASGGLDEETEEEVLSRGFAALRDRGVLITADDFESEAIRWLGAGAVAKAIGGLGADKITAIKGSVHLFILNPDGTSPSAAQCSDLAQSMQAKTPIFLQDQTSSVIASALAISPIELQEIELTAIAALVPGDNPETRAAAIYAELSEYLTPGNLPMGEPILLKELELVVRRSGVRYVQSVAIRVPNPLQPNEYEIAYADVDLPNKWTAAKLKGAIVDLVDANDNHFIYPFGRVGDPD